MKGYMSEHHACVDCGVNTHPGAPPRELAEFLMHRDGSVPMKLTQQSEVYCVRGLAPYGGCLCVGCLEQRIGRKLKRRDFEPDHPFNQRAFRAVSGLISEWDFRVSA